MQILSEDVKAKLLAHFDRVRDEPFNVNDVLYFNGPDVSMNAWLCDAVKETGDFYIYQTGHDEDAAFKFEPGDELKHCTNPAEWIESAVRELWELSRNKVRSFYCVAIAATQKRANLQQQYHAATALQATDDKAAHDLAMSRALEYFPKHKGFSHHVVAIVRAEIIGDKIEANPMNQKPDASWKGALSEDRRERLKD